MKKAFYITVVVLVLAAFAGAVGYSVVYDNDTVADSTAVDTLAIDSVAVDSVTVDSIAVDSICAE